MNPFEKRGNETVSEWGEMRLIEAIRKWLGDVSPPSPEGIGDDCSVFTPTPGSRSLVATDPILWLRHFDEKVSPERAAAKVLKRNISDIAAMGGKPRTAVVSLLLPPETSIEWLKRFYLGLRKCAVEFELTISGGDISEAKDLAACVTLIGETSNSRILTRTGASVGDHLFVTGTLGGSLLGRHADFTPRLEEGQWLAGRSKVTAAIDISDGIAKEIPLLLPSDSQVHLVPGAIPISADAEIIAAKNGKTPLFHALSDGEDYELLFAVKAAKSEELTKEWQKEFSTPLHKIGKIQKRSDQEKTSLFAGLPDELIAELRPYEHFRK